MQPIKRNGVSKFKQTYYGHIERIEPGRFHGLITSAFHDKMIGATAESPAHVQSRLRAAVTLILKSLGKSTKFGIKLSGDTEPEHVCYRA